MSDQLTFLRAFASCTDAEQAVSLVSQHPSLLSSQVEMELEKKLEQLSPEERAHLSNPLEQLHVLRTKLEEGTYSFPVGEGPMERIWSQLTSGAITAAYAAKLAQELGASNQLSLVYIRAIGAPLFDMAQAGKWRLAVERHRLLMTAVEAMPQSEEARVAYWQAGLNWIMVVKAVLGHLGDYRLYRDAIATGGRIATQATALNDQENLGEAWHRLGVLSLDPYHEHRSNISYEQQIDVWRQTLENEAPDEIAFVPREKWWMPEPGDALHTAEEYLRKAIEVRRGHEKGLSLKALVDTLNCRYSFLEDYSVNLRELRSLSNEAMAELDPERDLQYRVAVLATLLQCGAPVEKTYLDWLEQQLSAEQLFKYVKATGDGAAIDLLLQGTQILQQDRPLSALKLLRNGREIVVRLASEKLLSGFLERELTLIVHAYAAELAAHPPKDDVMTAAKQILHKSIETNDEPYITCAKLICLAMATTGLDQEEKGLTLLDWTAQLSPQFVEEHGQALTLLRGILFYNHGAWAANAGQVARSVWAYVRSLTPKLDLNLTTRALECLTDIEDLARNKLDLEVALFIIHEFKPLALTLERVLGEPATHILQRIYKDILPILWTDNAIPVANTLLQLAKGVRFAAVSQADSASAVPDDELSHTLLSQIQEAEDTLREDDTTSTEESTDTLWDGILLVAYEQDRERFSGSSQEQRLANLRRSYDAHLNKALLSHAPRKEPPLLDIPTIQAALDERTVLVNCYIGQSADAKKVTNYLVACTREEVFTAGKPTDMRNGLLRVGSDVEIMVHPFALEVSSLREYLTDLPPIGKEPVSRQAAAMLEDDLSGLFGSFVDTLEKLKTAGKDHLCIVPHGPLHYYPFHLLGTIEKPLADNWIVTYLPNLNLLVSRPHQQAGGREGSQSECQLTSVGLSFAEVNPFHLGIISQSITEATAVASTFGETPVLEQEATKQRVIKALKSSRYVHLSTHGQHFVEAPAFQCLYLAADNTSDGRLYSYELLPLDLHNLDLITLSACETALGRFDFGDNLRGIPASLLFAGVSTIVGTLWDTDPKSAELFFTLLYQELRTGKNRLDAFAAAQRRVRDEYPQYMKWGSFYFIGDWSS